MGRQNVQSASRCSTAADLLAWKAASRTTLALAVGPGLRLCPAIPASGDFWGHIWGHMCAIERSSLRINEGFRLSFD